jgi:hypothetical protein
LVVVVFVVVVVVDGIGVGWLVYSHISRPHGFAGAP